MGGSLHGQLPDDYALHGPALLHDSAGGGEPDARVDGGPEIRLGGGEGMKRLNIKTSNQTSKLAL